MSEENNNPHEADLLDAMTLSPAESRNILPSPALPNRLMKNGFPGRCY